MPEVKSVLTNPEYGKAMELPAHHKGYNDKKSMTGKNLRPKKDGNGGKGTWGNILDTFGEAWSDRNDPNYDSDEEPYRLVEAPVADSTVAKDAVDGFKERAKAVLEEYYASEDVKEAADAVRDMGEPQYHHHFVKKAVTIALDRKDREKELACTLLSALYADVISPDQMARGCTNLVESVEDLVLDIPDAADLLSLFLARAVVDDILPPAYLTKLEKKLTEDSLARQVVHRAEAHVNARHGSERVLRCWGGGGVSHVDDAKRKIAALLAEYKTSEDINEACRCIHNLHVPFFHHEVVKKAVTMAIEEPPAEAAMLRLLSECRDSGLISSSQALKGLLRVKDGLDDLSLDVPNAKERFASIVEHLSSNATSVGTTDAAAAAEDNHNKQ